MANQRSRRHLGSALTGNAAILAAHWDNGRPARCGRNWRLQHWNWRHSPIGNILPRLRTCANFPLALRPQVGRSPRDRRIGSGRACRGRTQARRGHSGKRHSCRFPNPPTVQFTVSDNPADRRQRHPIVSKIGSRQRRRVWQSCIDPVYPALMKSPPYPRVA